MAEVRNTRKQSSRMMGATIAAWPWRGAHRRLPSLSEPLPVRQPNRSTINRRTHSTTGLGAPVSAANLMSNSRFQYCQQRHGDHGNARDHDAGPAALRRYVPCQRRTGFVEDVQRQRNEMKHAPAVRNALRLDLLRPRGVQAVVEPPE